MKNFILYLYGVAVMATVVIFLLLLTRHYEQRGFEDGKKFSYDKANLEAALNPKFFIVEGRRGLILWDHKLSEDEMRFVTLSLPEQLDEWNKARGYDLGTTTTNNGRK